MVNQTNLHHSSSDVELQSDIKFFPKVDLIQPALLAAYWLSDSDLFHLLQI